MHTVQCTLYTVQCTVHSIHYTVYSTAITEKLQPMAWSKIEIF